MTRKGIVAGKVRRMAEGDILQRAWAFFGGEQETIEVIVWLDVDDKLLSACCKRLYLRLQEDIQIDWNHCRIARKGPRKQPGTDKVYYHGVLMQIQPKSAYNRVKQAIESRQWAAAKKKVVSHNN